MFFLFFLIIFAAFSFFYSFWFFGLFVSILFHCCCLYVIALLEITLKDILSLEQTKQWKMFVCYASTYYIFHHLNVDVYKINVFLIFFIFELFLLIFKLIVCFPIF